MKTILSDCDKYKTAQYFTEIKHSVMDLNIPKHHEVDDSLGLAFVLLLTLLLKRMYEQFKEC